MSRDARNSILLWAGALAFAGLLWAIRRFDIAANIPDRLLWPIVGILIGVNVVANVWNYAHKRRRNRH